MQTLRGAGRRLSALVLMVAVFAGFIGMTPRPAAAVNDQWEPLGGIITAGPDAASLSDGRAFYFAPGLDRAVWMNDGENWTSIGGQVLGGVSASNSPVAQGNQDGRIDVVARGLDNAVWHTSFDPDVSPDWTPWASLGGLTHSDPAVLTFEATNGDDADDADLVVLVRGLDNTLWERRFDGGPEGGWGAWQSLGGILKGGPGAGGNEDFGTVAVRGLDDAAWHRTYDHELGEWSEFASAGGIFSEDLSAEFLCTPALFGRGVNNGIWTNTLDPDTGWLPLGGIARSGPGTVQLLDNPRGDWIAAVRGNDGGLWIYRHDWFPDAEHC